jgi:hypothetical protein
VVKLADIFRQCGKSYIVKYSETILPSHKKAVRDISRCRTPQMGGQVYCCRKCNEYHYSYHSCGNRNCNTCQDDKADQWLEKNRSLLLPVNYFMVTFTLPDKLRQLARGNQKLFYNLLFKCSAESIESLSADPKYIGGKAAYLGVLHTWSRKLDYHPHIHYIITGGGLSTKDNEWFNSNPKFLFPVKALSVIFKAKFRDALRKCNPSIFNQIPKSTWSDDWVVNSIPVGSGLHALKYLAQYVFRVAIGNNRLLNLEDGFVTFKYKDSQTNLWNTMKLKTDEFIRRFLQHVLPRGFVKVRYFGLFANQNRNLLNFVKELLGYKADMKENKKQKKDKHSVFYCPNCGSEMKLILSTRRGCPLNKPPPSFDFSAGISQTFFLTKN